MTSRVFHRDARRAPPVAVRGEGVYLFDAAGRRYLDASGGVAVSCLGHSHPAVIAAIEGQLRALPWVHSGFFTTHAAEELAEALIASAPAGLGKVWYTSGGSEAMEAALKLARQYHVERGEPGRDTFIARRQSYHGNTLGALAVGGNLWRRKLYEPLLIGVRHVAPCYAYRDLAPGESEEAYGERLARELEEGILDAGPGRMIAFVAETVVGATAGAVPPVPGYFRRVREVCDRHGVLLILDEVMCGLGRTGTLHAYEQEGVAPDLLVVAKGLGAGYQPIGAVLVSDAIHDAVRDGSGAFQHGHTYQAHPVGCAAALATLRVLTGDGFLATVRRRGEHLRAALEARFANHPHAGDLRGRGLFHALELVADRAAKEPFDPALQIHARVKREAMARGLLCYPMGGTIDGCRGDHVLLAPPFIAEDGQLDEAVEILGAAIDAAVETAAAVTPR
jgi:adenosylmethionine-8-amino-7-oxononanoate aminotransferase